MKCLYRSPQLASKGNLEQSRDYVMNKNYYRYYYYTTKSGNILLELAWAVWTSAMEGDHQFLARCVNGWAPHTYREF